MTVPVPIIEWAPAKGPYEVCDTYLNLTGAASTFASAPTNAAFTGGATYQVIARVAATDYTPASTQDLMSVYNATNQRSWKLSILASGALQWTRSTNGTADVVQASSVPPLVNGTAYWLGVEYNSVTGAVAFYRAADSQVYPTLWTGWTSISSHVMTSGSPFASTARLVVGSDDAGANRFIGRIYEARMLKVGFAGGAIASFTPDTDGYSGMSSFTSTTSSTLEVYTLSGGATLTGDWADLSTDVQSGNVRTGRQYELDRFRAGTATITWNTDTRLFDFDNSASVYAGQLQPMRQFRIRMRRSSQVWPIFRGYCIDWDQTTDDSDNVLFTTVRLGDAFALLDATTAPSPYASAVLAKSPRFYLRFDDANQVYDSSSFARHGTWNALATIVPGLLVNDSNNAVSMGATSYGQGSLQAPTSWSDFTLEFWIRTTASDATLLAWVPSTISAPSIFTLAGGKLRVTYNGTLTTVQYEKLLNDGNTHHVVYRWNGITGTVSVDNVAATTSAPGYTFIPPGLTATATYRIGYNPVTGIAGFVGTLDELALYDGNATASTYSTGTAPWTNQTTGQRVTAVLDAIGWPAKLRDIDTGDSTMQLADFESATALTAVQQAADTELGQTYADEYGSVHHRARSNLWLQARSKTSQVTFQDRWSGTTKLYSNQGFAMVRDALLLRNPVTAARANGTTITRKDDALITSYGLRNYQAPLSYDSSDLVVADRAEFLLARYKQLKTRIRSMTVNVHRDPADLAPAVGTTVIGTRITVVRKPLNQGTATSVDQIVEGITHQFSPLRWTTIYQASPLESTVYFILDDATYGQLDQEPLAY